MVGIQRNNNYHVGHAIQLIIKAKLIYMSVKDIKISDYDKTRQQMGRIVKFISEILNKYLETLF